MTAGPRPSSAALSLVHRREDPELAPEPTPLPADRYTVLLLDEAQLDRLLHRQSLRSPEADEPAPPLLISSPPAAAPGVRFRMPTWLGLAGALAALGGVVVVGVWWAFGSSSSADTTSQTATAVVAPPVEDTAPVVSTGASLSVDVAATPVDEQARLASQRLSDAGWPAFTWRVDPDRRHVLVGPYASIEEAEATQGSLVRAGYAGARVHVDDRLRVTPAALSATRRPKQYPDIALVAAPGRLSFVFELSEEPRHVSGQRMSPTTFMVTAGPLRTPVEAQTWKAPGDVRLVKRVALAKPGQDPATMQGVVTLAENAEASVRLQGRRVYVDIFRHIDDTQQAVEEAQAAVVERRPAGTSQARVAVTPAAVGSPRASASAAPVAARSGDGMEAYRTALQPLLTRFEEVQPFLGTTVATASPDILAALNGSCAELEQAAAAITPPADARVVHNLLRSAAHAARLATGATFSGDRVAQVKESSAQFAAAKIRLAELGH